MTFSRFFFPLSLFLKPCCIQPSTSSSLRKSHLLVFVSQSIWTLSETAGGRIQLSSRTQETVFELNIEGF